MICEPCPKPEEVKLVDKLPDMLCEVPEVVERPSILPTIRNEQVLTDTYEDALRLVLRTHNCEFEPKKPDYRAPMVFGKPPLAVYNQPYEFQFRGSEGEPPYTFEIKDGELPPGLSLDFNDGKISGVPTLDGRYHFVVVLRDERNRSNSLMSKIDVIGVDEWAPPIESEPPSPPRASLVLNVRAGSSTFADVFVEEGDDTPPPNPEIWTPGTVPIVNFRNHDFSQGFDHWSFMNDEQPGYISDFSIVEGGGQNGGASLRWRGTTQQGWVSVVNDHRFVPGVNGNFDWGVFARIRTDEPYDTARLWLAICRCRSDGSIISINNSSSIYHGGLTTDSGWLKGTIGFGLLHPTEETHHLRPAIRFTTGLNLATIDVDFIFPGEDPDPQLSNPIYEVVQ